MRHNKEDPAWEAYMKSVAEATKAFEIATKVYEASEMRAKEIYSMIMRDSKEMYDAASKTYNEALERARQEYNTTKTYPTASQWVERVHELEARTRNLCRTPKILVINAEVYDYLNKALCLAEGNSDIKIHQLETLLGMKVVVNDAVTDAWIIDDRNWLDQLSDLTEKS